MIKIKFDMPHKKIHGNITVETMPPSLMKAITEALRDIIGYPSHMQATLYVVASFEAIADEDDAEGDDA